MLVQAQRPGSGQLERDEVLCPLAVLAAAKQMPGWAA